jgi:hypothetical protein
MSPDGDNPYSHALTFGIFLFLGFTIVMAVCHFFPQILDYI